MQEQAPLNEKDGIEEENNFLKMKLMLEHGADFGGNNENELPAELENEFLKNVMAFEQQWAERKTIKVFDKIGRPDRFKPVAGIEEEDIHSAWKELRDYLNEHGIDLDACSPKVTPRELYRFAVEELFDEEMDDMDMPGWTTNFIYDEFYPDKEFNNTESIRDQLFNGLFSKDPIFFKYAFSSSGILFNGKLYDHFDTFNEPVESFKSCFDEISLDECNFSSYFQEESADIARGTYKARASSPGTEMIFSDEFSVRMVFENEYWVFKEIEIRGLNIG